MPAKGWTKGFCLNGHVDPPRGTQGQCNLCKAVKLRQTYMIKVDNVITKLGAKCVDCGNTDRRVLDFDHVPERGIKVANVTTMLHWKSGLEEELAKCDLVCANCHRIRTAERRGE